MRKAVGPSSLTSLREKVNKIGAKVVSHGRYVTFQMAEVAVSQLMFRDILMLIAPASGAARTSLRGARIECDKQRRQGCAMTKAKQQVLCATRQEPSIPCRRHPSRLGLFAMDARNQTMALARPAIRGKTFF
jgi:hypothetical protein